MTQKKQTESPFHDLSERLHAKIKAHMGWEMSKVCNWFCTPNPHMGNLTPDQFMLRRPDKIERLVDAMIEEGKGPSEA